MGRQCWLDLFTGETWEEFQKFGSTISGFRPSRWNSVQKMKPGDYLLCYLTGVMRWVGILEIIDKPFKSSEPKIWSREDFPCRLKVKPVVILRPEEGVPLMDLRDKLSYFQNMTSPTAWTGHFRGSPCKEKDADAEIIISALEEAKRNPVTRAVDPKKLHRQPKTYETKKDVVTIPEEEPKEQEAQPAAQEFSHEHIQWLLLKMGSEFGLDLWVARNNRNTVYNGARFGDIRGIKDELPLKFDPATNKTIELIDVVWLKGNSIVAAFEIEHTTSIYSGLLRLADLVSMQPNIKIKLYIVASDERREKVVEEINRPTFLKLPIKLSEICQYISYSALKDFVDKQGDMLKYIDPGVLDKLAEPCTLESE